MKLTYPAYCPGHLLEHKHFFLPIYIFPFIYYLDTQVKLLLRNEVIHNIVIYFNLKKRIVLQETL